MLKFEWKMSKSIKILKFEYNKAAVQSKCWNLSEKGEIDQMLTFYCQVGIDQNVGIWLKNKE